jgi:hypothetical protein
MEHFVIAPGGLHIEMAALQILGDWLEDSGWTSSMAEANIASSGMVNSFIKCTRLISEKKRYNKILLYH